MQEMIINGLLAVIIIMSAFLLLTGKNRGLTKNRKKLIRILVSTVVLLILQLFAKTFPTPHISSALCSILPIIL